MIEGEDGYEFYYDAANGKVMVFESATVTPTGTVAITPHADSAGTPAGTVSTPTFTGTAPTIETITMTDDDSSSSKGVQLYVVTEDGFNCHLEFVSPTNADGHATPESGSSNTIYIADDDSSSSNGVALYFDEDGTAQQRWIAANVSNSNCFMPISGYESIIIADDDSSSTNGVAVYFDEDAANAYERFLFVSPTNVDGTNSTTDVLYSQALVAAGLVSTPTFTGAALATHSHASTAAFTGTATTAAPLAEVGAATSLAGVDNINIVVKGW